MKTLILIFFILTLNCTQSPLDEENDKNSIAKILLPLAEFLRTVKPTDDEIAAANHAAKLAYVKSLPLYDVSSKTATEIKALSLDGIVESVDMSTGKPVVKFYVATKATSTLVASRLIGFGWTTITNNTTGLSGTAFVTRLTAVSNINFTIAKYVEGTNGSPGKWVNYIVTSAAVTNGVDSGGAIITRQEAWSKPTNDVNGTIVDNGDGSYTYTFYRDITKAKNFISQEYLNSTKTTLPTALTSTRIANTGDVTYNSSLPHRMVVYIGTGTVRGTGTNNADGSNVSTGVPSVNFDDGETLAYDFIPATGQIKALQRDITVTTTCNNCHKNVNATTTSGITTRGLIFHGAGGRNDVRHCVMCHTEQIRSITDVTVTSDPLTGIYPAAAAYYVFDGYNVIDFPVMVHKFHMESHLVKDGNYCAVNCSPPPNGYNFKTKATLFITLAQSKLCYNCHTTNKSTVNEDNWKTRPSRIACGACHDGVNFDTGEMFKAVKTGNLDKTHGGGKQLDDSKCASCHTTSDIIKKHGLE